jgi:hypothetical protein
MSVGHLLLRSLICPSNKHSLFPGAHKEQNAHSLAPPSCKPYKRPCTHFPTFQNSALIPKTPPLQTNLLSIKKKTTPKINSSQSAQASKRAMTTVPIANRPPPAAIACCGKLGFLFPPKPTGQKKQFQIPNSKKLDSM